jgi:hypothetical protein
MNLPSANSSNIPQDRQPSSESTPQGQGRTLLELLANLGRLNPPADLRDDFRGSEPSCREPSPAEQFPSVRPATSTDSPSR